MKKLAIGCGLVTVLLLLVGAGGVWYATRWVKSAMPDLDRLEQLQDELAQTYGKPAEYVPPVDGVYDRARVEVYVSIREALVEESATLAADFDELVAPDREKKSGLRSLIEGARTTTSMLGQTFFLLSVTDSLLLANEMGQGEYAHLNMIALEGYMGVDVDVLSAPLDEIDPEDDGGKAVRDLTEEFSDSIRDMLRSHASNLRRVAGDEHAEDEAITAYVDSVAGSGMRRPFVETVPPSLLAAFESLSMRLEFTRPRTIGAWLAESPVILDFESNDRGGARFSVEIDD